MTESSKEGLENLAVIMEDSVYAEIEAEYLNQLPEWATDHANGEYVLGAQLPTRDGRRMGNAHIIDTLFPPQDSVLAGKQQYRILTDAGTELTMTTAELDECFYPPKWVSDVQKVKYKFAPRRMPDPKSICCRRARHSNGWHHNEHCPNWVLVY